MSTIFLALIMFNILIAVISETFAHFEERKDIVDLKEMISVLSGASRQLRKFNWMIKKIKRDNKIHFDEKSEKKYKIFIIPKQEEEEDQFEVLGNQIDSIQERFDSFEENMKEVLRNQITSDIKEEVRSAIKKEISKEVERSVEKELKAALKDQLDRGTMRTSTKLDNLKRDMMEDISEKLDKKFESFEALLKSKN